MKLPDDSVINGLKADASRLENNVMYAALWLILFQTFGRVFGKAKTVILKPPGTPQTPGNSSELLKTP